jgi:hypothetical protein
MTRSDYPIRASSQPEPLLNVPVIGIGPRQPRWSVAPARSCLHPLHTPQGGTVLAALSSSSSCIASPLEVAASNLVRNSLPDWLLRLDGSMPEPTRQKITFGEMRAAGVRGLLICCSDYHCSHWSAISGDRWPDSVRLSDVEPRFTSRPAARKVRTSARILIGGERRDVRFRPDA